MTTESDTPAEAGTAGVSVDDGANMIASLLSPPDEDTGDDVAEAVDTAPDADASDQVSDDETNQSENETPDDDHGEEQRYRLSDGTEVTLAEIEEWRKGNLRQSDYTRKTQEIAATRKELESRQAEITQRSQKFQQTVDFAIAVAQAAMPAEPDATMLNTDPLGYIQQKAMFDERKQQLQQLYAAKQEHEAAQAQIQQHTFQQWAEGERNALVDAMPELRDPAKARQFNADLVSGIQRYGFGQNDLSQVYDHRLILLAKDAMAYQKLMAGKPRAIEKAKDAPPVQKPGKRASQTEGAARVQKEKMDRLRQTGSLRAGADVILDLIKD